MDTNENNPFAPQITPNAGVSMAPEPVAEPAPEQPVQPMQSETVIIPPSGSQGEQGAQNPSSLVPNVTGGQTDGYQAPPAQLKSGGAMKKILLVLALLVLVGVGFFAVKSLFGSQSPSSGGVPTLPIRTGGTQKEVTLTYWGLWENDAVVRGMIAEFETKNPGIKVQYIKQSPKQYRERLQSAINRGEGPDAFRFHNTWVPMLHTQLATVPSTVMTSSEFATTFYPVASTDLVSGTTVFGIPMMIDGLGLYINQDLFATAGVTAPTTWTDILNMIPKLTVKNGSTIVTSAIALGTTGNVEHYSDILALMFLQNGANLTSPSGTEAEQTLIFYRKFAEPQDPLYTWSDAMDNSVSAFANGRVAMILAPSWRAHEISQLNPQLHFSIVPAPQLPGNSVSWASYWVEGVSAKSKNQQQAWEFVKYITSREGTTKLYTEAAKTRLFGEPYARVELASTIESDPYAGAYVKQGPTARSFPLASRTHDNGINDKLIKYLEDAINAMVAGGSPAQVLTTVSSGFRQVLSSYGLVPAATPAPR